MRRQLGLRLRDQPADQADGEDWRLDVHTIIQEYAHTHTYPQAKLTNTTQRTTSSGPGCMNGCIGNRKLGCGDKNECISFGRKATSKMPVLLRRNKRENRSNLVKGSAPFAYRFGAKFEVEKKARILAGCEHFQQSSLNDTDYQVTKKKKKKPFSASFSLAMDGHSALLAGQRPDVRFARARLEARPGQSARSSSTTTKTILTDDIIYYIQFRNVSPLRRKASEEDQVSTIRTHTNYGQLWNA